MHIVLAASVYPPEAGGPSSFAALLSAALQRQGHTVSVVRFNIVRRWPSGIRHALFAYHLLARARHADALIAFDTITTGAPAAIAAFFAGVPLLVRIGGDFLWEAYVERTHDLMPLPDLYTRREKWGVKERAVFFITSLVLKRAYAAFNSPWLLSIWRSAYRLQSGRTAIIENAIEPRVEGRPYDRRNILLFGRKIALKNRAAFERAFGRAQKKYPDIILEKGLVPKEELDERMRSCYAVALPSISDVAPNYIIDAIRMGKPFLLTKYSGYAERFKDYGIIVDPLREDDMVRGIEKLADPAVYQRLVAQIASFDEVRTYDDVAKEYVALLEYMSKRVR